MKLRIRLPFALAQNNPLAGGIFGLPVSQAAKVLHDHGVEIAVVPARGRMAPSRTGNRLVSTNLLRCEGKNVGIVYTTRVLRWVPEPFAGPTAGNVIDVFTGMRLYAHIRYIAPLLKHTWPEGTLVSYDVCDYDCGSVDWRPMESVPEDYYAA